VHHSRKLSRASSLAASSALFMFTSGAALASDELEVNSLIEKWVADLNKGDFKSLVAACAPHAAVVDGFPPYAWQSCADWMKDYNTNNQAIHAPLGIVSIGTPIYKEFNGSHAYEIYPATFTDAQNGKPVVYKGTWTIALVKTGRGWAITGSAAAWTENNL
jgi:hypothetical protein